MCDRFDLIRNYLPKLDWREISRAKLYFESVTHWLSLHHTALALPASHCTASPCITLHWLSLHPLHGSAAFFSLCDRGCGLKFAASETKTDSQTLVQQSVTTVFDSSQQQQSAAAAISSSNQQQSAAISSSLR